MSVAAPRPITHSGASGVEAIAAAMMKSTPSDSEGSYW